MDKQIQELREQIDRIDAELIALLKERMVIVSTIGKVKKDNAVSPLDATRWHEVLISRVKVGKESGLSEELILNLWNAIHKESLLIEQSQ